jgi:cbb3-type cytochrome oxidase cytochrome c subunit
VVVIAAVVIVGYAVVVGALIYLKPPPVRFVYRETASTRTGEMVFRREGCLSCHELFGNGTSFGPALDGVGSRRNLAWLKEYLRSPRPGVGGRTWRLSMPAYDKLEEGELDALMAYLGALRELDSVGSIVEPPPARPNTGD